MTEELVSRKVTYSAAQVYRPCVLGLVQGSTLVRQAQPPPTSSQLEAPSRFPITTAPSFNAPFSPPPHLDRLPFRPPLPLLYRHHGRPARVVVVLGHPEDSLQHCWRRQRPARHRRECEGVSSLPAIHRRLCHPRSNNDRSNTPDTTRSSPSPSPMARSDLVRSSKLEVSAVPGSPLFQCLRHADHEPQVIEPLSRYFLTMNRVIDSD